MFTRAKFTQTRASTGQMPEGHVPCILDLGRRASSCPACLLPLAYLLFLAPLPVSSPSPISPFDHHHLRLLSPFATAPPRPYPPTRMSDAESVTISLLPVSLSLVHLPRSRLEHFTQHVLRQILQPNPVFLNVTCNEVEVSLFAEYDTVHEFHKAARKDARRLRQRDREAHADARHSPPRSKRVKDDWEPVEVTSERWKVLQIDSHSDSLGTCNSPKPLPSGIDRLGVCLSYTDNSGARVHELSAPLAAAGISILYQSSYMSDFIFVSSPPFRCSDRLFVSVTLLLRVQFLAFST